MKVKIIFQRKEEIIIKKLSKVEKKNKYILMIDCCKIIKSSNSRKKCIRIQDNKIFTLPRKFSYKKCMTSKLKGFTMRASCAPYKNCKKTYKNIKKNKQFFYNPNDPKKSFDVYIDKNPNDTISIKYKTLDDVKNTIKKLENLYKSDKYTHKRIWQVGMIMYVRLKVFKKKSKKNIISLKNILNFWEIEVN